MAHFAMELPPCISNKREPATLPLHGIHGDHSTEQASGNWFRQKLR